VPPGAHLRNTRRGCCITEAGFIESVLRVLGGSRNRFDSAKALRSAVAFNRAASFMRRGFYLWRWVFAFLPVFATHGRMRPGRGVQSTEQRRLKTEHGSGAQITARRSRRACHCMWATDPSPEAAYPDHFSPRYSDVPASKIQFCRARHAAQSCGVSRSQTA
jgi:hypothetical protein